MNNIVFGVYSIIFSVSAWFITIFLGLFMFKLFGPVLLLFSALGLIFGIVGIVKNKNEKVKVGLILSIIGLALSILPLLLGFGMTPLAFL